MLPSFNKAGLRLKRYLERKRLELALWTRADRVELRPRDVMVVKYRGEYIILSSHQRPDHHVWSAVLMPNSSLGWETNYESVDTDIATAFLALADWVDQSLDQ